MPIKTKRIGLDSIKNLELNLVLLDLVTLNFLENIWKELVKDEQKLG